MRSEKKLGVKRLLLPVLFVILLVLTIILRQQAFGQDKETLGSTVSVKVTDIRVNAGGLNPGGLKVTVSYQGEDCRLHGVPANAQFVMENSRAYGTAVSAVLYRGKLYYDSASIYLWSDKLYYAALAGTFLVFILMFAKFKEKLQGDGKTGTSSCKGD